MFGLSGKNTADGSAGHGALLHAISDGPNRAINPIRKDPRFDIIVPCERPGCFRRRFPKRPLRKRVRPSQRYSPMRDNGKNTPHLARQGKYWGKLTNASSELLVW